MNELTLSEVRWIWSNKHRPAHNFHTRFGETKRRMMELYKPYNNWGFKNHVDNPHGGWECVFHSMGIIQGKPLKALKRDKPDNTLDYTDQEMMFLFPASNKLVIRNTKLSGRWGAYSPYWFLSVIKIKSKFGIKYNTHKMIPLGIYGNSKEGFNGTNYIKSEQLKNGVEKCSIKINIDGEKYSELKYYVATKDTVSYHAQTRKGAISGLRYKITALKAEKLKKKDARKNRRKNNKDDIITLNSLVIKFGWCAIGIRDVIAESMPSLAGITEIKRSELRSIIKQADFTNVIDEYGAEIRQLRQIAIG